MHEIFPGRYTASSPREAGAVFLLGMRVNTLRGAIHAVGISRAMVRMQKHLATDPDSGMLGCEQWFARTTILLSYWRTPEDIQRFASDPNAPHAPAWREFTRKIGASRDIGIWHETYRVGTGDFEGIYANMPRFGMAAATGHIPVSDGMRTARQRMRADADATRSSAAADPGHA